MATSAVPRSHFRDVRPSLPLPLDCKQPVPDPPSGREDPVEAITPRLRFPDQRGGIRDLRLQDLPPEIHLLISKQLIYPDALSLKHTSRYFYSLVDTGIDLKVDWLMERRKLHLECPNNTRCDLGSDLRFCRGSVALLMQRRREHVECESRPGLGCLVFGTPSCIHRRSPRERARRWLRAQLTVELWWILLAAVPLLCSFIWAMEFSMAR